MRKMFVVDCGVYPFSVMVSIGFTARQTMILVQHRLPNDLDAEEKSHFENFNGRGKTLQLKGGQNILWLRDYKYGDIDSLATLNHEIFHVVYQTLWKCGLTLSDESEEAYSYLVEYLTKKILEKIVGSNKS